MSLDCLDKEQQFFVCCSYLVNYMCIRHLWSLYDVGWTTEMVHSLVQWQCQLWGNLWSSRSMYHKQKLIYCNSITEPIAVILGLNRCLRQLDMWHILIPNDYTRMNSCLFSQFGDSTLQWECATEVLSPTKGIVGTRIQALAYK